MKQNENGRRLEKVEDDFNTFLRFFQIFPNFYFILFRVAFFSLHFIFVLLQIAMFRIDAKQAEKALFSHRSEKDFASVSLHFTLKRKWTAHPSSEWKPGTRGPWISLFTTNTLNKNYNFPTDHIHLLNYNHWFLERDTVILYSTVLNVWEFQGRRDRAFPKKEPV